LEDENEVESSSSHGLSNADVGRWVDTVNNPKITTTHTVNATITFTEAFNGTNHRARALGLVSQTLASGGPAVPLVPTILVRSTGPQQGDPQRVEIRSSIPIINAHKVKITQIRTGLEYTIRIRSYIIYPVTYQLSKTLLLLLVRNIGIHQWS
jgi:hypothetical protein